MPAFELVECILTRGGRSTLADSGGCIIDNSDGGDMGSQEKQEEQSAVNRGGTWYV